MLFKAGDKVLLKYTGESGEVVSYPEMGIVQVKLSEEIIIPVNVDDLSQIKENFHPVSPTKNQSAQIVENPNIDFPTSKIRNLGFFTGFIPQQNKYEEIIAYNAYLINDSKSQVIFEFSLISDNQKTLKDGYLAPGSAYLIGKIQKEVIEQQSEYTLQLSDYFTSGIENTRSQTIKLKPKTFFSREDLVPFFDKLGYLFEFKSDPIKKEEGESLVEFTKSILTNKPKKEKPKQKNVPHVDPLKRAVFTNELDLHIEAILEPGQKLEPQYILQLQLAVFDQYMAEAVRHGIEKVYIVHGLGTGKLKAALFKRLSLNPYVLDYKNEYLPSFGFGATEVKLR